jgi:hypothetical protein
MLLALVALKPGLACNWTLISALNHFEVRIPYYFVLSKGCAVRNVVIKINNIQEQGILTETSCHRGRCSSFTTISAILQEGSTSTYPNQNGCFAPLFAISKKFG